MIQTRRLAEIAIILYGFYLLYSSLTAVSAEPQSLVLFYLALVVGTMSMGFGIFLIVKRKPLFTNEITASRTPKGNTARPNAVHRHGHQRGPVITAFANFIADFSPVDESRE